MKRTVIVAAMERELRLLVRTWQRRSIQDSGRSFLAFENDARVAVVSGMGRKNAERAARAAVALYAPATLVSAGLAGALIRSLKAGSVVTPNVVVDAADGTEYRCVAEAGIVGGGVLVTASEVAGVDAKAKLVDQFHALVVDMEAAGVAKVAQEAQIGFRCVKAISDEAGFVMPPMARFVDANGSFETGKFVAWAAVRPWQWGRVSALAANSAKAARALCEWLDKQVRDRGEAALEVATLKRAEFPDVSLERR